MQKRNAAVPGMQPLDRVLDDHNCGIDDQADRDCETTKAHEVCRHAECPHHRERDKRGEWESNRDDEGRADVAEERQEENDHEHRCLHKRLGDRANGFGDEVGTVVEDLQPHAVGQARLQLF